MKTVQLDFLGAPKAAHKVKLNIFDWKLLKSWYIVRCMQLWLHATVSPARLTVCYLITYSKFRFWPFLARNASETPRDRWHYEANAGLPACVVVFLFYDVNAVATRFSSLEGAFQSFLMGGVTSHLSRSSMWPVTAENMKVQSTRVITRSGTSRESKVLHSTTLIYNTRFDMIKFVNDG